MLPYLNYLCYDSFKDGVITQTLFSLVCLYIVFFVQFSRYEFRLLKSEINTQLLEYLFQTLAQAISNFDLFKERCAGLYIIYVQASATQKKQNLVGSSGLEPPTSRLSGVRSNHLSYEPTFKMNFFHLKKMVEMNGIEPMTPCLQSRCSPS